MIEQPLSIYFLSFIASARVGALTSFSEICSRFVGSTGIGQSIFNCLSKGESATPFIPETHSWSKKYKYSVLSSNAWNPLHTPYGTNTWTPGTRWTVATAPIVGLSCLVST